MSAGQRAPSASIVKGAERRSPSPVGRSFALCEAPFSLAPAPPRIGAGAWRGVGEKGCAGEIVAERIKAETKAKAEPKAKAQAKTSASKVWSERRKAARATSKRFEADRKRRASMVFAGAP